MGDALKFSLADFFFNDSKSVLEPPSDFEKWMSDPSVQVGFSFYEQKLLAAPRTTTEILSNVDGQRRRVINLMSYNYLGLSTHPEVIEAAIEGLKKYGLGASGAPLLSGTYDLHVEFARRIAEFKGKEDCILYSSGLGGNVGAIQGLMRKGDVLIMDEKCHKSLIDGGVLAGAKMLFFHHNNPQHLDELLAKNAGKRTLVVVEGVYSMDGDLAKLPEIVQVVEKYPDVEIYIDEAHSSLMFGKTGRGVAEHFDLEDKVGISFGTLSKSFGGVGGFVCSNARIIRYLKGYSSPYNFSCAPSPVIVAGLMKALEVATRDSSLRDKLWENTSYFKKQLDGMNLNLGDTESQVIPIIIGSSGEMLYEMAAAMQTAGLFLQPVDFPAVPAEARRFRISMSAQLTKEEMDEALGIIEDKVAKRMRQAGLIGK
ncbi:MAG TPA: aminotransferase class I/II-fold pyridoxal phosphate-dependent enzyme [Spirochaetota bacterium]|nr:aminotransferase class I/II-fold pyridoxal phosphate-dependent enzyme [Spirochaetota bacterium]HPN81811.1 aminotransferase class I/II-fold pyridoxal phosphate-dependent enzyme [Spirochaetota bacterium]